MAHGGINFGKSIVQMKAFFFDRTKVTGAVDDAIRKKLNWIGGYVRRAAKNSIKKAKSRSQVSVAGQPPLSRLGLLKEHIYYAFEPQTNSVIVGAALLNAKGKDVPHNLEFGGSTIAHTINGKRSITIKPRPYMRPALERSQGKIAEIWKNSVKK